jgi:S-formylglutathione hydrolase FrmB
MSLSRRGLLVGGLAVAAVGVGVGVASDPAARHWVREQIDPIDEPDVPVPATASGPLVSGTFTSSVRGGTEVGWSVAYPPAAATDASLPLALYLHGRGGDHGSAFGGLGLQHFLAKVVGRGTAPYAIASVDGGDHTYYHRRADGDDPQRMITDELLPRLAERGLRTENIGLGGWSMGGYGALLLAETLGPRRVAGVAVDSPALWTDPGSSAEGAFDDAADFVAHDVFAGRPRLAGIPIRVACGRSDPFYAAVREFVTAVPDLVGTVFTPGGHENAYWNSVDEGQLRFLGRVLRGERRA